MEPLQPTPMGQHQVTELLRASSQGDGAAQANLFEHVYGQLHAVAQRQMAQERASHTLQPTALVHEAWLRMFGNATGTPQDRVTFFATAARAMRQVLVDHARRRGRRKRGGDQQRFPESVLELATQCDLDDVLAIDEALARLRDHDAQAARVVDLRFFAGLDTAEVAAILGSSERTVAREWAYARAWLFRALQSGQPGA